MRVLNGKEFNNNNMTKHIKKFSKILVGHREHRPTKRCAKCNKIKGDNGNFVLCSPCFLIIKSKANEYDRQ
jgi:hypothetical protein